MSKNIKTRDIVKNIKHLDKAAIVGERMRNVTAKTKDHIEETQDAQFNSPSDYATSKVMDKGNHLTNKAVIEAKVQASKGYRYIREKRKADKNAQFVETESVGKENVVGKDIVVSKIKSKETIQKDIKTTDRKATKIFKKSNKNTIKNMKMAKGTSKATIKTSQEIAKQASIQSAKVPKESYHTAKRIGRISYSAVKNTIKGVKVAIGATRATFGFLCSIGSVAILIILVIALIGGVFMTGSSENGEGNQLSKEVIAYTSVIQRYADEYEIPQFTNVIQAIMMQESGGKGNDPMQSSECAYNTKYPHTPNSITDPEYSIKVGIQNFADCLKQANCTEPLDISFLSLALQGYNFGNGYISWALKNFGAYSQGNAKVFADEQAHKHGWSSYGDPEYVPHVLRYYQFSGLGTSNSKIVNIAASQIGNQGGTPYWSWYGYNERVEWCACFVSWCANLSGNLNITVPKYAAVKDGIKWYQDKGKWKGRNYTPKTGDVIFFDWENDGVADHTGLVEKIENGIVYVIEGNSNDQCRRNTYTIGSKSIFGYGIDK